MNQSPYNLISTTFFIIISTMVTTTTMLKGVNAAKESTWQPWEYSWDTFPSLYFAANPEGDYSDTQLEKLSKFQVVMIEFRQSQFLGEETGSGKWADGDEGLAASTQCQNLKEYCIENNKDFCPPCLTYRSGEWYGTMYPSQERHMRNNQNLFLTSTFDCDGFTDYPLDIINEPPIDSGIDRCRPDFRLEGARDYYVNTVIDINVGNDDNVDGVFIDNGQSVACDNEMESSDLNFNQRGKYQQDQLTAYIDAFTKLNDKGKYPILSTTNRYSSIETPLVPWGSDCPDPEEENVSSLHEAGVAFARNFEFFMWNLGSTCQAQIQNSILEAQAGVPLIVHTPYFRSGNGCLEGCFDDDDNRINFGSMDSFLEFSIAAFLVGAGPGSYYSFSDMEDPDDEYGLGGWADSSWPYFPQYDTIQTGSPQGDAVVSGNGKRFTREFSKMTVMVDCDTGEYSLTTKSVNSPTAVPTSKATEAPSSKATEAPTPVTTTDPTSAPVPTSTPSCNDSNLRFRLTWNGRKISRGCEWVDNKATKQRCAVEGVSQICADTCESCSTCADASNRFRLTWNGKKISRDCSWVANKATVQRCNVDGVRDACRATCGEC